jgi:UDP-2,3-diacylglucosamine pyrophosphatase LpxH
MKKWKTIIMSDLHLGAKQSRTDKIIEFLKNNKSDVLILNGDIIDGWA